jgi:thiosulfate/3-mercaptopyruvate sulfurtransferase
MITTPLVSVLELHAALDSGDEVVLLDAGRTRAAYDAGHLPGALHADGNEHLASLGRPEHDASRGGRHPLPSPAAWCATLGAWGIAPETTVVVYDDQAGANAAARAWWMPRAIGHERVALLDGGLTEWIAAGLPLSSELPPTRPQPAYPGSGWILPTVEIGDVDMLRHDPAWRVVDVRSAPRFAGIEEPIDPVAGHISGAINVPYSENLAGGRFKSPETLRHMYATRLDGVDGSRVVVHCGSGVTACHTLLALELAGIRGARLYVGSWSEWCRRMPRS